MSENQPLKLSADGKPFESEQEAYEFIKANSLDRKKHSVVKYAGGWAIMDTEAMVQQVVLNQMPPPAQKPETYSLVIFNAKSSANDSPYVPLTKNGVELRISRGREVVIPDSFLEIADNAVFTQWEPSDDRNVPMKNAGKVRRYGYTRLRAATEEEFRKMLGEGNRITNDAIERMKRAAP
jgi:hypothetical protein